MNDSRIIFLCYEGDDVTGTTTIEEAINNKLFKHWYNGKLFSLDSLKRIGKKFAEDDNATIWDKVEIVWYDDNGITGLRFLPWVR